MPRKTMSNLLAAIGVVLAVAVGFGPGAIMGKPLVVQVDGLRSDAGVVRLLVYDSAAGFEGGDLLDLAGYRVKDAVTGGVTLRLARMRTGEYAVMVHHDENANDVFDTQGAWPLEGWGYSNNVGQEAIPSFMAARVVFDGSPLTISMLYAD